MCLFRLVRGLFYGLVVGCWLFRSVGIVVVGVFALVCGVVSTVSFCSMSHSRACGIVCGFCLFGVLFRLWLCGCVASAVGRVFYPG